MVVVRILDLGEHVGDVFKRQSLQFRLMPIGI
jgi:hypothetical protein